MKSWLVSSLFIVLVTMLVFKVAAQPPGISELNEATKEVKTFFNPFSDLIMAIGAIVGLVGGVRVYMKWNTGHRYIDYEVMGWFGSCLFLELVSGIVKSMFL